MDAFAFGEEAAAGLGVRLARTRLALLSATALLTAALVRCVGVIGFVSLILPHATSALTGSGHARLLSVTALTGASSWCGSTPAPARSSIPQEVLVSVVTSLIGVPASWAVLYRG
ncbi:iron chelate uptake ABC transporter family permease subunit [Streptomyces salinarius]|uniref:iron chelate uptake ABC transporter family permease subunit n=1 Tax=Streptomyces salinarius TaxID=2762598 RepID=UPI0021BD84B4|nr:iron chelate uptake ABC transporter family permease subunit [Streptomyces salinarius]